MKTSELIGPALDWAVAKYENKDIRAFGKFGVRIALDNEYDLYSPTKYWAQGGPIIERERISLRPDPWENGGCKAFIDRGGSAKNIVGAMYGPTVLIAAMRCYVASKLGDEIEIPEELR